MLPSGAAKKINFKIEENFRPSEYVHQRTTIRHRSTTNSPSKHHVLHPVFLKNPAKTPLHHTKKNNAQKSTTNPVTMAE
jgi:hypothetical protein